MQERFKPARAGADVALVHDEPTHAHADVPRPHPLRDATRSDWIIGATLLLALAWTALRDVLPVGVVRGGLATFVAVVPPVLAALIAFRVARRGDLDERIRNGFGFIGGACGLAAASSMVLLHLHRLGMPGDTTDVIGSGLHYTMVVAAVIGLCYWIQRYSVAATFGTVLDMLTITLVVFAVVWTTTFDRALLAGLDISGFARLNQIAWPIGALVLLSVAVLVLSQIGRQDVRGPVLLATFGIVGMLGSDLVLSWQASLHGDPLWQSFGRVTGATSSLSGVLDLGWHLGFLAIAFAATRQHAAAQRGDKMPLIVRHTTWETLWAMIPFTMLAAAIVGWQRVNPDAGFQRGVLLVLSALLLVRCGLVAIQNLRLARVTTVDQLTGAHNHRHFQEQVHELAEESVDRRRPLSLVLVDIDDFEAINDAGGHVAGDRVLREVAWTLRQSLRPGDQLFRLGADEFALAVLDANADDAVQLANDARAACVSSVEGLDGQPVSLTFAVASLPLHTFDAHELVHLAQGTLYWAKLNDKRSVTVYDPQVVKVLSAEERVQLIEQRAQLRAVLALARALDARDAYTARHSQNVARNAVAIAFELGWTSEKTELLRIAGLLHDVGKIGVRDTTLRKSERLTDDEWAELRQHPVLSARVIDGVAPDEIVPWVLGHHERIDGRGYPSALAGDDVPLGARILAVADTFDAMTTSRSYRPALSVETAVGEIIACAGTQFDPLVVRAFLNAMQRGSVRTTRRDDQGGDGWDNSAPTPLQPAPMGGEHATPTVPLDPEFLPAPGPGPRGDGDADGLPAAA